METISADDAHDPWLTATLSVAGMIVTLERLPVPLWVADARGKVRWGNGSATQLFGAFTGRHFSGLFAPDRVNEERELFARRILGHLDATVHPTAVVVWHDRVEAELASVPLRGEKGVTAVLFAMQTETVPTKETAAERRPMPRLTPRQHEVLTLLAHGKSTRLIAGELKIAEETARNHIRLLLQELGVHTRLEAVVVAFRSGWL